ncbi:MAG: hypothetical protein MR910_09570 [Clostridiales bacterium]|nr:hypothetical protein [Clostridiales bacterium]
MKKSTIPGTKIMQVTVGKKAGEAHLGKSLEKIKKIACWDSSLKNIF